MGVGYISGGTSLDTPRGLFTRAVTNSIAKDPKHNSSLGLLYPRARSLAHSLRVSYPYSYYSIDFFDSRTIAPPAVSLYCAVAAMLPYLRWVWLERCAKK